MSVQCVCLKYNPAAVAVMVQEEPMEQLIAPKEKMIWTCTVTPPRLCPRRFWGLSAGSLATLASPGGLALYFNVLGQSPGQLN